MEAVDHEAKAAMIEAAKGKWDIVISNGRPYYVPRGSEAKAKAAETEAAKKREAVSEGWGVRARRQHLASIGVYI